MNNKGSSSFRPDKLPLLGLEYEQLVSLIGQANRSITAFRVSLNQIPDRTLLLSPLALSEAVASSSIENIRTTLEGVLKHEVSPAKHDEERDNIREVINCRRALSEAVEALESLPLARRVVCQIHKTLLSGVRGLNKSPGNFRTTPVHIGQFVSGIKRVIYTPPEAQYVPNLFSNLEQYIHHEEKDPLVQAAIIHAQFEIIHPFLDGNGRTGRILIPLFLHYKQILDDPVFPLSEYLDAHKDEYYLYLRYISERGDWLSWIRFFLTAITEQSKNSANKVQAIQDLYRSLEYRIEEIPAPKHYPKILGFIFSSPIFNIGRLTRETGIPRPTCSKILATLVEKRIIRRSGQSRGSIYIFEDLLEIIRI